ncbi:DUF2218 domain-containing protein [Methylopila sp. 73B]|uniref:DUF2218 domain-containing protein n=1 Tax=Methylopila sp. 73B TaxID=1120792 RepID=UPI000377D093|nr:DUF2218 domain-containing protein [Methylopila sp. 73B]
MPTSQGARYVAQLCSHWGRKFQIAEREDGATIVMTTGAVVEIAVSAGAMAVEVVAAGDARLIELKAVVTTHLDRFAFREAPLLFEWRDQWAEARST